MRARVPITTRDTALRYDLLALARRTNNLPVLSARLIIGYSFLPRDYPDRSVCPTISCLCSLVFSYAFSTIAEGDARVRGENLEMHRRTRVSER